jgi:hypothetical protein
MGFLEVFDDDATLVLPHPLVMGYRRPKIGAAKDYYLIYRRDASVSAARVDYPWCDTRHYCTRYLLLRGNDLDIDNNMAAAAPGCPTMMTGTRCFEFIRL